MRKKLGALKNKKRPCFSAKYSKTTISHSGKIYVLILEVKYKGKIVADHLWLDEVTQFLNLQPNEGDIIQFKGSVSGYIRGSLKNIDRVRSAADFDYCLINLSDFKILK